VSQRPSFGLAWCRPAAGGFDFVRDYPVAQTVVFFARRLFIVINIVVDIAYAWLDPRVRIAG